MAEGIPFRRVAILGTGLIGGSFGLAVRKHFPEIQIAGWDRDPGSLDHAIARGAIAEAAGSLDAAVHGADLVYIALPVSAIAKALPSIAASADARALITDAGSAKVLIAQAAREHFRAGALFLGGHPMAGKECSGIQHADAELFRGAPYALIGEESGADERERKFAKMIAEMGAQVVWCDADTHDWAVGIVSHLPQLIAVALARVIDDESDETGFPLALAGQGLQDSLRLAGSPYTVWRDILMANRENVSRALARLSQAIEHLQRNLSSRELEDEFRTANAIHTLLQKRK